MNPTLTSLALQQLQPVIDDIRAQVRAEAEAAAAKGAREAVMPYILGIGAVAGVALLVSLVRR